MSRMSQLHADLCERNGGVDPNDLDVDWDAPVKRGNEYICLKCGKTSYHNGGRPICAHCGKLAPKA